MTRLASSGMLHDFIDQNSIPHHALDLLWHRPLHVIILLGSTRHVDVDGRALTREHLGVQTLPAEIQLCRVHLIEHDRRQGTEDLHLEFGGLDHVDAADQGVYD